MKQVKKLALALVFAAANCVAPASYGFMMEGDETTVSLVDMTQTVNSLRDELNAGETSCEAMLAKIDGAIASIDSALDKGIAEEEQYLGLRDELVDLRLNLPCLGNELTQEEAAAVPVADPSFAPTDESGAPPMVGGFGGPGAPIGGAAGGAGGAAGGLGLGPLALGGIAAAVAIPVAVGANDNPGNNASTN